MNILYLNNLQKVDLNSFITESINSKYTFLNTDENNRTISLYKLNYTIPTGCSFSYPNILLHSNKQLFLPIKEKTMSLNKFTIYEEKGMKYNFDINQLIYKNIKTFYTPVFFFNYNLDNYYHFLYDSLPNLYSYIFLKKHLPELKIILYYPEQKKKFCKFVYEFLELLDIQIDDIIIFDENTIYKNIYITTSYTHDFDSNLPPRKEIFELYQLLIKKALQLYSNNSIKLPTKIYISRRTWIHNKLDNIGTNYTTRRKLTNEDELVALLTSKGFTEIFTENLDTIQKINLFYNAKYIVGAIGGGISNSIFSNNDCKLIAIISPYFLDVNKRFIYSLNNTKLTLFNECSHVNNETYKKYMRVKIKNTNLIGEIIDFSDELLKINCSDGTNTGWNNDNEYKILTVKQNDIIKLDNGLNSPYRINIEKLENIL